MPTPAPQTVVLESWVGPWDPDDPDANYKADIALYATQDPMRTLGVLADAIHVPVGAIARYVLARYATSGSGGLLELGPSMVHRLWEPIEAAEADGTDEARLRAYQQLNQDDLVVAASVDRRRRISPGHRSALTSSSAPGLRPSLRERC